MSYADAAKERPHAESRNTTRKNADGKYFNENPLAVSAVGPTRDEAIQDPRKHGYPHLIPGVQTLEFGKWIAAQIDNEKARNKTPTEGVVIGKHTIYFHQHRRSDITKVFVNQLPLGISHDDVKATPSRHGRIRSSWPVKKSYYDRQLCNGDWCILFDVLREPIPSYVNVRGWNAYVTYRGQAKTCRRCNYTGHLARDCPFRKDNQDQDQPENMDVPDQPPQNASEPEDQSKTAPKDKVMENVTVEDCQVPTSVEPGAQERETQSQAWADSPEENPFEAGSEKPQDDSSSEPATPTSVQRQIFGTDTEISDDEPTGSQSIWGDDSSTSPKPEVKKPVLFCPRCKVNSHSEEECTASVIKEANKKALSTGDGRKGKKYSVTYKKFRSDLELVVMRGKETDGVRYILEMGGREEAYALYLYSIFGRYTRAECKDVYMSGNREVMDLWRRYSKSMDKTAVGESLRTIHGQI